MHAAEDVTPISTPSTSQPDHLVVLVNGILASPNDWIFVKEVLTNRLGNRVLIHASTANSYFQTFQGIDVAGKRLADEIEAVARRTPTLSRLSIVAHSLGGLFARYALACLLARANTDNPGPTNSSGSAQRQTGTRSQQPLLAGLQPATFMTLATPHLGVRGHKQLPFLLGLRPLELLAAPVAPLVVGSTGRQLFLTDGGATEPPLLLRMTRDCQEGPFLSALRAFHLRCLYANAAYDHMVGWRTSCIRRETELPKLSRRPVDPRYRHVVRVEDVPAVGLRSSEDGSESSAEAKKGLWGKWSGIGTSHDLLEEEMVAGLQTVPWRKVDVSFHSASLPFMAHNHIHVKHKLLHSEGAGVIEHLADTLQQQEAQLSLEASL